MAYRGTVQVSTILQKRGAATALDIRSKLLGHVLHVRMCW